MVKPLVLFFSFTFAITWASWAGYAAVLGAPGLTGLRGPLLYLGIFAPSLVAIALTARATGRDGVWALLRRLFEWRVGAKWYVFAIGYMAAIKLTAAVVHRVAFGEWPQFSQLPWYLMLAATFISVIIGGQSGEEIGWRGYALPRLAARMGLARASLLLGVIWATWHLPIFYFPGADKTGQSFPLYLMSATALSVAITWLFAHTRGSLLLTMLMHSAINNTKDIVPSMAAPMGVFTLKMSIVGWLTLALLWACAAYFLLRLQKAALPPLSGD